MLFSGSALTFFLNNVRRQVVNSRNKYQEAVKLMKKEYTSLDQKTRLLDEWRTADITEWFKRYPEKSQIEVFRLCFDRLMKIQRQLDEKYQDDLFLRDQTVSRISNLTQIRDSMKNVFPQTSTQSKDRIGSFLSAEPGSAASHISEPDFALYGLGQKYGGDAMKKFRSRSQPWKKSPNFNSRFNRAQSNHRRPNKENQYANQHSRPKRFSGCYVCKGDHKALDHHSPEEVSRALLNMKNSRERIYLAVDDVVDTFIGSAEDGDESDSSEGSNSEDEISANFLTTDPISNELNTQLEQKLSNNVFAYNCGFLRNHRKDVQDM